MNKECKKHIQQLMTSDERWLEIHSNTIQFLELSPMNHIDLQHWFIVQRLRQRLAACAKDDKRLV